MKTKAAKSRKKPAAKKSSKPVAAKPADKPKTVLVLRTCDKDLKSHGGFQWPASGPVECPDWEPVASCGNGLHGLMWGEGKGSLLNWSPDAKWLVVEVEESSIVAIGRKVKFPRGVVVFCGDRLEATDFIVSRLTKSASVVGACVRSGDYGTSTSGDYGTSTSGYGGTSTSGDGGTSTSGDRGTSTSGDYGTSTSGYRGTSTSGDYGTSTSGHRGTSTSGDYGTSTSGYGGTSTSGDGGTSTSGDGGTSTSGDYGTSTSGNGGTSTSGYGGTSTSGYGGTSTSGYGGTSSAGYGGTLVLTFWDGERKRLVVAYVGENGIEPNRKYTLNDNREVVEVK